MGLIKSLNGQFAKIKVLGIGGGGNNAVNSMISSDHDTSGIEFIAINTDSQVLLNSKAQIKIQIGEKNTKGLGAGGNPLVGQQAAEESKDKIKELLQDTDMVFITGGMGGGTCTGAAPVIAEVAKKELGILTIAIVTKPFNFEGTKRMINAEEGIRKLKDNVDTLIIIPNQQILSIIDKKASLKQALEIGNSVLNKGTMAISELITKPGLINLDFADVKSIMYEAGTALMGVAEAEGDNKVTKAVQLAIESPLIEADIDGAKGILINITGSNDLPMMDVETAANLITQKAAPNANIIFGATVDEQLKDKIKITVIATGFSSSTKKIPNSTQTTTPPAFSPQQTSTPTDNFSSNELINKYLHGKQLPTDLNIEDEFDIPSFLRNEQN